MSLVIVNAGWSLLFAAIAFGLWRLRRPLPRIYRLGDPMGCNGCDAVTRPLRLLPNGGYYCTRCADEIEATS